ncbi:MAG: hypothetical protein EP322_07530, partial [Bacteroidetes bacterium]
MWKELLKVPEIQSNDQYEISRFKLTWNVNVVLSFALILLIMTSFLDQSDYIYVYGSALILVFGALLYMKLKLDYRIVALVLSILMYSIILISYFSINGYVHFLEPFWALVIILYVYFIRGKVFGGIALGINIIATAIFFTARLDHSISVLTEISTDRLVSMSIEFMICLSMIGYLIHQFIDANKKAELSLISVNEELRKEKVLIDKQNDEKTVLLQEIHHRVKNNLQIVTSLLRMQAEKIDSEETKVHFQDAINRIMTMSLVHQKLYQNENLNEIDLKDYLNALCEDLLKANRNDKKTNLSIEVHCEKIGTKTLVPLGLILTELISNSLKHAFPSTIDPAIYVRIDQQTINNELLLSYGDNGQWKESSTPSFGIQL